MEDLKKQVIEQEQQKELDCVSGSPCTLTLADDGTTVPVSVPPGKNPCFDKSFSDNLDRLGFQTSYHSNQFTDYLCTKETLGGQCGARYVDRFRFRPQPGTPLPRYWFIGAGERRCQ